MTSDRTTDREATARPTAGAHPSGGRARRSRGTIGLLAECAVLALLLLTTAWLVRNSLPYLTLAEALPFLVEKGTLALEPWWKTIFIAHVVGGLLCLATGPFLVWNHLVLRSAAVHRILGRTYFVFVLFWGAPAGLVLATTAKGGILGKSGFALLGVLWLVTTSRGLRAVRERRLVAHVAWMGRSYAMATSALSFRAFHLGLHLVGVADRPNYIASIWASLVVSVVAGELLAARAPRLLARGGPRRRTVRSTSDPIIRSPRPDPIADPPGTAGTGVSP